MNEFVFVLTCDQLGPKRGEELSLTRHSVEDKSSLFAYSWEGIK